MIQRLASALAEKTSSGPARWLQGLRDDALYVFIAPEFRPGVEERHAAILRALGEDKQREATALGLIPGPVGSPIYREG